MSETLRVTRPFSAFGRELAVGDDITDAGEMREIIDSGRSHYVVRHTATPDAGKPPVTAPSGS